MLQSENYIQLYFTGIFPSDQELLIAQLFSIGCDGFEQGNYYLKACIAEIEYDEALLRGVVDLDQYNFNIEAIQQKNWNEEWDNGIWSDESQFLLFENDGQQWFGKNLMKNLM